MKYVLLGIIIIICAYIGYGLSRFYVTRFKFFSELISFIDKVNCDINFSKSKLIKILEGFDFKNREMGLLLANFKNCLNEEISQDKLFEGLKILKDEEKNDILSFFSELGKLDVYNQTKQLENYKNKFGLQLVTLDEEKKKYGNMYLKLGIILGVLIALILI